MLEEMKADIMKTVEAAFAALPKGSEALAKGKSKKAAQEGGKPKKTKTRKQQQSHG